MSLSPKRDREWWNRIVLFPLLLVAALLLLGYQAKLVWERSVLLTHDSAVPWSVLVDGYDTIETGSLPTALASLSQQDSVTLYGYMLPIESAESHSHFLLISHSASCPFHQLFGQGNVVEVKATQPIKFQRDPLLVSGRFTIDEQAGADIQYRLYDATSHTP